MRLRLYIMIYVYVLEDGRASCEGNKEVNEAIDDR